jgi:polyisoprenoid-binding protein YceI
VRVRVRDSDRVRVRIITDISRQEFGVGLAQALYSNLNINFASISSYET